MTTSKPRALLLWHSLTGYSAAGIRALAGRAEVTVLARPPDPHAPYDYSALDLGGADVQVADYPWSFALLDELMARTRPDLICVAGSGPALWRALHRARRRYHSVTVMTTDYNWTGRPRQRMLQLLFAPLRRAVFDVAWVPGARSTEYVHKLGFPKDAVLTGVFTLDAAHFAKVAAGSAARWTEPSFLFVGRLVPEKATDILAEAYRVYRANTADPWPLLVVGQGPFDGGLGGTPGVTMRGFVQPDALPELYAAAGALVLPSREDLWGVVALEACTAGLPVVVSDGCGVSEDLATPANGFTVPVGDTAALATALTALAGASPDQRREWGANSSEMARSYGPDGWADTLLSAIR
jgi:glycosyltransferase involved in cell wall biosynthesis